MAMMREIMGCFTRSKREEGKGDLCGELVMMLLGMYADVYKCAHKHRRKSAGCKVFPTTHTQCMTHTEKQHKLHPMHAHASKTKDANSL